ncbi:PREDICTED: pectinesterase PPME1-like [Fragaria vesca subsp. vesca]|uniref:pectinesterase PPME1-like n=1 Tax=Fragaria vesca subsp. vesca TaxID=101020 RepID=UPI0002C33934|nr:PREDICTED: pectinesterase PPME1-like [Fragaria vesca subsp. vesca]
MAGIEKRMSIHAALMMITTVLLAATVSMADDPVIPSDKSAVDKWFQDNVKPLADRKSSLDPDLVKAEDGDPKIVKVMANGGDFKKISEAIDSIPASNTKRVIIYVGGGVYNEKITIPKNKPFVTLMGDSKNMPNLTFNGDSAKYGTLYSATLSVESDYFVGVNLNIINSSPRPDGKKEGAQALALKLSGNKAALYNCQMFGFQDTLCDDQGNHFIKDSYVEGTVDFIFGSGKSLYLNTHINVLGDSGMTVITANAREGDEDKGYSFVHCSITGTGSGTFLGRAWRAAPKVTFAYTEMGEVVKPEGWTDNNHPEYDKSVSFGEYKNTGPGSSMSKRVSFTKELSDADAKPFISLGFIDGSKWLLPPPTPKV